MSDPVAIQLITSIATLATVVLSTVLQRKSIRKTNKKLDEQHETTVTKIEALRRITVPRHFDDLPDPRGPERDL